MAYQNERWKIRLCQSQRIKDASSSLKGEINLKKKVW